jgi:hypothetical protein
MPHITGVVEKMTLEEIQQTIADALPMRVPHFDADTPPRERVSKLEDYLLASAEQRGALIEARHWLRELEDNLRDQIDSLQGWQAMLQGSPRKVRTKTEIQQAKQAAAPALFSAGRVARKLRGSVDDQIDRFAFEDQFVISRAYSMISGS